MEKDVVDVIPERVGGGNLIVDPIADKQQRAGETDPGAQVARKIRHAKRQITVVEDERSVQDGTVGLKARVDQDHDAAQIPPEPVRLRLCGGYRFSRSLMA